MRRDGLAVQIRHLAVAHQRRPFGPRLRQHPRDVVLALPADGAAAEIVVIDIALRRDDIAAIELHQVGLDRADRVMVKLHKLITPAPVDAVFMFGDEFRRDLPPRPVKPDVPILKPGDGTRAVHRPGCEIVDAVDDRLYPAPRLPVARRKGLMLPERFGDPGVGKIPLPG